MIINYVPKPSGVQVWTWGAKGATYSTLKLILVITLVAIEL